MPLTLTIEDPGLNRPEMLTRLQALRDHLSQHPDATRDRAAGIVRANGFWAYTGGRHVAVHERTAGGRSTENRLAFITGTGPDWQ